MGTKTYCEKASCSLNITYKTIPFIDDSSSDESLWIKNLHELSNIQAILEKPASRTDLARSKNIFIHVFLTAIQNWLQDFKTEPQPEITKTIQIFFADKTLALIVFSFKKSIPNNHITVHATIEGTTEEEPIYLRHLIEAALQETQKPYPRPKIIAGLAASGAIALGVIIEARRKTITQPQDSLDFFKKCEEVLRGISLLVPDVISEELTLCKDRLFFSTTIQDDLTRFGKKHIHFELRKTIPSDKHPSTYVLYDDKKTTKKPDEQIINKLIYEISTFDDFTTAILVHLLVRKVDIGAALEHFENIINECTFKDIDVMKQFGVRKSGTLQQALDEYKKSGKLDNFF